MSFKIAKQNGRQTLYNTSYSPLIHSSYVLRRHVPHMLHTFPPLTSPPSSVASSPPRPRGPFYPAGSSDTRPAAPAIPPRIRIELGVQAALADWALERQQLIQHRANTTMGSDATNRLGNDPWRLVQLCLAMYVRALPSAASQQNGGKSVRGKIMHGRAVGVARKIQLLEKFASKTGLVVPRRVLICDESPRIPTSHLARASLPFPASFSRNAGRAAAKAPVSSGPRLFPAHTRLLMLLARSPSPSSRRKRQGRSRVAAEPSEARAPSARARKKGHLGGRSRGQGTREGSRGRVSVLASSPSCSRGSRPEPTSATRRRLVQEKSQTHGQSSVRGSV